MTAILYRYLMIVVACISLLIGLQIPSFIDQYEKRIDAHLREVTANLQPFQDLADKYFEGDITRLVAMHRNSETPAFREEGAIIEELLFRKHRFEADLAAMNTNLPQKAINVLLHGDRELIDETIAQYSYTVPINQDALVFGAFVAFIMLLFVELLLALAQVLLRMWVRARA